MDARSVRFAVGFISTVVAVRVVVAVETQRQADGSVAPESTARAIDRRVGRSDQSATFFVRIVGTVAVSVANCGNISLKINNLNSFEICR